MTTWMERRDPRPLVLRPIGQDTPFELVPARSGGQFDGASLGLARQAFAFKRNGATAAIHPRLLNVLYRAVTHFKVPYVTLVSGYRAGRGSSRHTQGRAADVVLPGVRDKELVAFLRKQGFVGVGLYPASGFVHVDVRAKSYFWVDRAGPGRRSRLRQVAAEEAIEQDERARARGEEAVPDRVSSKRRKASARELVEDDEGGPAT